MKCPHCGKQIEQPKTRGSRCPDKFLVTAKMHAWIKANAPDIDWRFETQNFVDYWRAKAGKDAVKLDWTLVWYTWMRRAQREGPRTRAMISNGNRPAVRETADHSAWVPPEEAAPMPANLKAMIPRRDA